MFRIYQFLRMVVAVLSGVAIYSACPTDWHPILVALATGLGSAFCFSSFLGLPLAAWAAQVGLGVPWYWASLIYLSPAVFYWAGVSMPGKEEA